MSDLHATLVPRPAFAGLPIAASEGSGVVACDRDGLGLATVLLRKGQHDALTQRMRERFGMELPTGPHRSAADDVAFIATGPGTWLATKEQGGNSFAKSLADAVGDLAAVSDQCDGLAVLRLSGPKVRDALAKLAPIDLHPSAFKVGDAAGTVMSYVGATLWRLADERDGSAVFEVAVYRSLSESFWSSLTASTAQFGFKVVRADALQVR